MLDHWINRRLKAIRRTQRELADALGLFPNQITQIVRGERKIRVDELPRLASFLQMDVLEVMRILIEDGGDPSPSPTAHVYLRGVLEGEEDGDEWPATEWVSLRLPAAFGRDRYALSVVGRKMIDVLPPGALVLYQPIENYTDLLSDGDLGIFRDGREDRNRLFCRELKFDAGGLRLLKRNPKDAASKQKPQTLARVSRSGRPVLSRDGVELIGLVTAVMHDARAADSAPPAPPATPPAPPPDFF